MTITDYTDRVTAVPETDTAIASQSSLTKVIASSDNFKDVCGELIGMGQNRPVQRPPLSLTFCGEHFSTPQTLAVTVILPHTVTLQCLSLPYCWQ